LTWINRFGVANVFGLGYFLDRQITMQFLVSREYPVVDYQTMAEFIGHEGLFRTTNGVFWLHMSSDRKPGTEERIIQLTARDSITWLNEGPEQFGSFWELAMVVPAPVKTRRPDHAVVHFS
jgi:hypothetical protein